MTYLYVQIRRIFASQKPIRLMKLECASTLELGVLENCGKYDHRLLHQVNVLFLEFYFIFLTVAIAKIQNPLKFPFR